MGTTTRTISFFSDEITIKPHTASSAEYIGQPVSLRRFANGNPITLEKITGANNPDDIGDYIVRACTTYRTAYGLSWIHSAKFMQGKEVTP